MSLGLILMVLHQESADTDPWEKYYGSPYYGTPIQSQENPNVSSSDSIYVKTCVFDSLSTGAITITDASFGFQFMHTNCFFKNCTRVGSGGAIQLSGSMRVVQHRFCAIACSHGLHELNLTIFKPCQTNEFGSFSYAKLDELSTNYVIEGTITRCENSESIHLIHHQDGVCGVTYSNFTKNLVNLDSGFWIAITHTTCEIKFTNVANSIATQYICIGQSSIFGEGNFRDYGCNIINNSQASKQWAAISVTAPISLESCTFIPADPGELFFQSSSTGSFNFTDCHIDPAWISSHSDIPSGLSPGTSLFKNKFTVLYECANTNEEVDEEVDEKANTELDVPYDSKKFLNFPLFMMNVYD